MAMALLWIGMAAQTVEPVTVVNDSTSNDRPNHHQRRPVLLSDTARIVDGVRVVNTAGDTVIVASIDSIRGVQGLEILDDDAAASPTMGAVRHFNPDPQRALWMSALCPGLGQIYNRRYWKLPIVVGAFVGLSYGASWNNRMYKDYSRGYRDVMDDDPDTHSYMDFFPPTVKESDLDRAWLQKVMKNKRDYYRRYREICVIAMVGVYLINSVDA